jgi:hypothetical protein
MSGIDKYQDRKLFLEAIIMAVINRKERFATEGIRFQRHNGDGTIPTPRRFVGFANTVDLSKFTPNANLTIKIDDNPAETKSVDLSMVVNPQRVTVQEMVNALNAASFENIAFSVDEFTGRLKGSYSAATSAQLTVELENTDSSAETIASGDYTLMIGIIPFYCTVDSDISVPAGQTASLVFKASVTGPVSGLPGVDDSVDVSLFAPALDDDIFEGTFSAVVDGADPLDNTQKVQAVGEFAAALDFGQGIKFGGNGLEIISFFDDETISIGLPKDIVDKEEIDIEGAKGTITRMVIGAMLQGMSPVVALKEKDYFLLELIQGGKLDRESGAYDPPLSNESEHPTFYAEIFSAVYARGSSKITDVSGYERILLRSMIGMEGDVPIEAKAWATYAFNLVATEYTDESGKQYSAWQELSMSREDFDALKVKELKV